MNTSYCILLVAITAIVTFALRAAPFVIFSGKREMPEKVKTIADRLPPAIIAVLVIYCVKSDLFAFSVSSLCTFIGAAVTVILHLIRRNTLLSIAAGTVVYMLCLHLIPGAM